MKQLLATTLFLLVSCTSPDANHGGGSTVPPPPVKASASASASVSASVSASTSSSAVLPNVGGAGGKSNHQFTQGNPCCPLYDEVEQACYGPTNCKCECNHDAGNVVGGGGTCCSH